MREQAANATQADGISHYGPMATSLAARDCPTQKMPEPPTRMRARLSADRSSQVGAILCRPTEYGLCAARRESQSHVRASAVTPR